MEKTCCFEIVEQAWGHVSDERDRGAPLVAERDGSLAVPGWDEAERVRVGVFDPRPLHVRIEVVGVDEAGAVAEARGVAGQEQRQLGQLLGLGVASCRDAAHRLHHGGFASSGQYVFNLSTKPFAKGTYQLRVDLHDGGDSRVVTISLK